MKLWILLLFPGLAAAQKWVALTSGSQSSLRGIAGVSAQIAWASGSGGVYLRTEDGGATWTASKVPGGEDLDFRDVHAISSIEAWLMSAGTGDKSRIYRTKDAGRHWDLLFTNPDPLGFFDAFAFWDAAHAVLIGDPVDGRFAVFTTQDGGEHWRRQSGPPAMPKEGAFAASGTCLVVRGSSEAWLGSGGPQGARVFHSTDKGRTWTVAATPLRNDSPTAGIFSLAFRDARHGVAVGGDYNKPQSSDRNIVLTADGGKTWVAPSGRPPGGYRSAVVYDQKRKIWIATGTSGSDFSADDGKSWSHFDTHAYNALGFTAGAGWAVGPKGRIARFEWGR